MGHGDGVKTDHSVRDRLRQPSTWLGVLKSTLGLALGAGVVPPQYAAAGALVLGVVDIVRNEVTPPAGPPQS